MKEAIKKIVLKLWPELGSKVHLPLLAVVVGIPDPPTGGETCTHERPLYAVDVQLLTENGDIDSEMPTLHDVPVAMTGAAPDRGFAALPQVGTVVEIAFAFGRQDQPFIRSILPFEKSLPMLDEKTMRWQQTSGSYQEVNASGDWQRKSPTTISDVAPKHWIGSIDDNFLSMVSDFMQVVIKTFDVLAAHTHPAPGGNTGAPNEAGNITAGSVEGTEHKGRVVQITK